MIKIFYKDKTIFLSKNELKNFLGTKILFSENYENQLNSFLSCNNSENINIYGSEEKEIFTSFSKKFIYIKAAGGIIYNSNNEILIIKRLDKFDFPKGKAEDNETMEETAKREISEECAIKINDINIISFLKSSYHIYIEDDKRKLKETFWYKILFSEKYQLKPQEEENIKEVFWVNKKSIKEFINKEKSYLSLVDLFEE